MDPFKRVRDFYAWGCERELWSSHVTAAAEIGISPAALGLIVRDGATQRPGAKVQKAIRDATSRLAWPEGVISFSEWYPPAPTPDTHPAQAEAVVS